MKRKDAEDLVGGIILAGIFVMMVSCAWLSNNKESGCQVVDLIHNACTTFIVPTPEGKPRTISMSPNEATHYVTTGQIVGDGGCGK